MNGNGNPATRSHGPSGSDPAFDGASGQEAQLLRDISALVHQEEDAPPGPADGPAYELPQMIEDLRRYQAELEIQNRALRFSQRAAEGASERFLTLFSSVPLALMVVDEHGQVLESNAMALTLFRPQENAAPLPFLLPLVSPAHARRITDSLVAAKAPGTS
ncbi:MAG: hypothetical protein IT537_30245, partial [Hyphomicrobiales bacterium]|nr:hypothetical protein [Hyphomicrobiales bacterium]